MFTVPTLCMLSLYSSLQYLIGHAQFSSNRLNFTNPMPVWQPRFAANLALHLMYQCKFLSNKCFYSHSTIWIKWIILFITKYMFNPSKCYASSFWADSFLRLQSRCVVAIILCQLILGFIASFGCRKLQKEPSINLIIWQLEKNLNFICTNER